tara:strand:- start:4997 stop:5983 length:987 start_codon:yes stop_codon:yes gene_type:complete
MRVLIIGGEGYIGSKVKQYLIRKKFKVLSFDNLIYPDQDKKNKAKKNYFIKYDLQNKIKIRKYIDNADAVLLLAGIVGDPITKKYPNYSKKINENSLKYIIKYSFNKNIKKLIFISTCSNYGKIKSGLVADENFKLNPLSNYSKSKVKIEKYILSHKLKKIKTTTTILRFATAFGHSKRMRFDLTVNQFILEMFQRNKIEVYDKNTWRPYCHVNDFARLISIVLTSNKNKVNFQVFNAGGDKNNYTKEMIAKNIGKYFPKGKIHYVKNDIDPRDYRVDFSKVKKVLNFSPKYSLNFGIKEILTNIKKNKYELFKKNFHGNYLIKNVKE